MSTRGSRFRQSDVTRALRGAEKAGVRVERIEVEVSGRIVIFSGAPGACRHPVNLWDEELGR